MNDGSGERTAIVGKTGLVSWKNHVKNPVGQKTTSTTTTTTTQPVPVHRLKQTTDKQPEPLCILGCCGRGSLLILWTGSSNGATTPTTNSPFHRVQTSGSTDPDTASAGGLPSSLFHNHQDTDSGAADCHTTFSAEELGSAGAAGAAGESNGRRENLGKIQFSIGYNFQEMTLTLKIIRAVELAAKDFTGTSDPYVKVLLLPDKKHKLLTNIKRRNLNPRWNEVFAFEGFPYSKLMNRTLYMQVLDYDRFSRDDPIGEVCLPLSDVDLIKEQTLWMTLQPCKGHTGKLGELCLSLCYQPTAESITVVVIEARELKAKDINGLSDPYVKIWLLRDGKKVEKRKTVTLEKCLSPVFNETFMFCVPYEFIRQTSLCVSVMDYDRMGRNELIGQVILGSKSGPMEVKHWNEMFAKTRQPVTQWHILKDFG